MEAPRARTPRVTTGQASAPSVINILAGIWLIIAPFVLSFGRDDSTWDSVIIGIVVIILAALRMMGGARARWLSWLVAIVGVWAIISPWIFSDSDVNAILWSDIIAGIVVVICGVWAAMTAEARV